MTLKEKLCEPVSGLRTETVNELEKISCDFAVEFAEWLISSSILKTEISMNVKLKMYKNQKKL